MSKKTENLLIAGVGGLVFVSITKKYKEIQLILIFDS